MNTKILMPALSPTMTEGNLTKWLVKVGQEVKAGDILAEIETDKATMEVEAVDEGKVEELLYSEGEKNIPVNSPIAILTNEIKKDDKKIAEEKNIEPEIFLNYKSKWLIKKKKNKMIENYLLKNPDLIGQSILVEYLINKFLSEANIDKACEKTKFINISH